MSWEYIKIDIYKKWKQYWFTTHSHDVATYSWDFLFTGGKEIRSTLFYELWRYLSPDNIVCGELAFAIECIHVASLVLDDSPWMDNADTRRGKDTLHRVFSPKKAVLICHDIMYMVYLIWQNNKPDTIDVYHWRELIKNKLEYLMIGQWCDLNKQGSLIELASFKTGILFEFVTEIVALYIGLDTAFWKTWGNNLGILFQWTDDWNDMTEDILQNNRNAFNEDYNFTLEKYIHIWQKIENGIGPSWFKQPFGIFMKSYFTQIIADKCDTIHLYNLSDLFVPYQYPTPTVSDIQNIDKKHIFTVLNGNDIIKTMFMLSDYIFKNYDTYNLNYMNIYLNMKGILWNIDENEWKNEPIIRDTLRNIFDDILDDIETNKIDILYRSHIKKLSTDALAEIEYHTIDEYPELHLADIKEVVQEIITAIEEREFIPEIKDTLYKVMDEIEKRE